MENVVIIGSGPAGLTAGIYTSRAALNPVLIAGLQPGGQLTTTSIVENWPGTPEGVDGNKLMQDMRAQAEKYGTRIINGTVMKIEKIAGGFRIVTDSTPIETKTIIVATGASAITLPLPNKEKLMGYGLSTCAVCDGFFYRNKSVAVVGGGDSAMEEAHYLASSVTLVHRRDKFRASKAMQDKVFSNPKIKIIWNTEVVDTTSDNSGLTGIVMKNANGETTQLKVDGLFMAIGHNPNTEFLRGLVDLDPQGYALCKPGSTSTNIPGIFAAGDVEDNKFRQAITSAGRGCQAALEAERFIEGHA
ncbi:thioredoxin-disulfide reductase [bacterium]|nr:thioredoxin-disulfide reductase [bacterium]